MSFQASRLDPVRPSASAATSQRARELRAEGHEVIDLGLGEPDFDTPMHIIEAAHQAALNGQTKYPPNGGTDTLKKAIIAKFKRDNQLHFTPSEIIVSNGAKQIIFGALMSTLEADQEVLLCAPYFDSYENIVLAIGGQPKFIRCDADNSFRLTPAALEAAISDNTRWLIFNSPSNPAGAMYSDDELLALGAVLARHPQVLVLADEIYEHIIFDDRKYSSLAALSPNLREQVLTVNGVSKAYAMTGWRIGYGAGPEQLISAMTKMQSLISSGACSIAQAAAAAALNGPQDEVERFRQAFEKRRDLVVNAVADIPGLTLDAPGGAFYALIGCEALMNSTTPDGGIIENDAEFVAYIMDTAQVATVPGSAYGLSPFFRISMANSETNLSEALRRIASCVAQLKHP
ncbi:pyridoxal phosphate-dependent aminotransferase [Leucothrix pacifica]|uniref:Aminotransferase n=1 Tax=Leucothrix pacifica TaxID=1247513 RepID=A0A317CLW8_9GAMM|nr:pyridoxal phosphate-dependent aminotransferase [Leucothrix pacifica]PWQ99207.1 aspartate aminotransferase [Leucothrix pacifica]